ncbi:MAG TPA: hypothetical protein VFA33_07630 [Bryobacteraceae bacterium]|nr:hypothetical protein [Bryobacteraceae bacterium]
MSDKITFPTNVPVPLALQFLEGKEVASQFGGNQHLFSTTDGRIFFVSETVGNILTAQLTKLRIQKGEPIEIIKAEVPTGNGRKSIQWLVNKVGFAPGEQPDGTLAVDKPGAGGEAPAPVAPRATETPINTATVIATHGNKPNGNGVANGKANGHGHAPTPELHQGWAQFLLAQTNALIDVYACALAHAGQYGNQIKPEDVRSILLSAFINVTKNGGINVA